MKIEFLPFEVAKIIIHELKLNSNSEWRTYCRSGGKPQNIPVNPDRVYRDKGWLNWPDWLGSKTKPNTNPLLQFDRTEIKKVLARRFLERVQLNEGQIVHGIYSNKKSVFRLRCKNGHEWENQAQTVLGGSWCRICFNEEKAGKHFILKDGLDQAIQIANE
ncbi:hypothetical protein V6O07_04045, partial [Arthrospira platensis SPKY2]